MATKKVHRIELKKYLKNIYQVADEQKTLAVLAHITNSRCIFRKNCASVPEERSAIPLQTEQSSAG